MYLTYSQGMTQVHFCSFIEKVQPYSFFVPQAQLPPLQPPCPGFSVLFGSFGEDEESDVACASFESFVFFDSFASFVPFLSSEVSPEANEDVSFLVSVL